MADKNYELTFAMSDGSEKKVQFTSPQGEPGNPGVYVGSGDMPEGYSIQIDPDAVGEEYVTREEFDKLSDQKVGYSDLEDKTFLQSVADLVESVTYYERPKIVKSVDEMTDTSKQYILESTNTVWEYRYEEVEIPGEPLYTNLANTNEDWADASRFSSNGAVSSAGTNDVISNSVSVPNTCVVRVKGIDLLNRLSNGSITRSALYCGGTLLSCVDTSDTHASYISKDDSGVYTFNITDTLRTALAIGDGILITSIRIGGTLIGTKEDVIITVNEEIKNSDPTYEKIYSWVDTGLAFGESEDDVYEERIVDLENRVSEIEENGLTHSIPDYWESAAGVAVDKVKANQNLAGHNGINFIMFSDMHIIYGSNNYAHNVGKLSRYIMDKCDIPLTCFLGDWVNSAGESTKELTLDDVRVAREILSPISSEELCTITGNHDLWFNGNGYTVTMEERYNAVCRHNTKDFHKVFGEDGSYYYVDNAPQKMRFIFLDGNWAEWTVDSTNKASYNSFAQGGYGQNQLQFLADSLKVQSGWSVCIFTHVPPIAEYRPPTTSYDYFRDGDVLIGIINAYADKTTYTGTHDGSDYNGIIHEWAKVSVSVDYTAENGELVAMFTGHRHLDEVFTDTLNCPIVTVTTCSGQKLKDGYARTYGTDTETSLDVVTINKATRTIYCTRVGAGSDRTISY